MGEKLNIGCGNNYEQGWTNTEITKQVKADYYFDAGKDTWPFENDTFDEAKAEMVFEHLPDFAARIHFIKEIHRVCAPGAKIRMTMPHFSSMCCWSDLQHVRGFSSTAFDYVSVNKPTKISMMLEQEVEGENNMFKTQTKINFGKFYNILRILPWFANNWYTRPIYEIMFAYMFPAQELEVNLVVIK